MKDQLGSNNGNGEQAYHVPVLLQEVIEYLHIESDGVYVDCTFGGGGHSRAILNKLGPAGKLVAFDQDADARQNLPDDPRVLFIPQNFRHVLRFLRLHHITKVNGLLADLGVSSHQFDEAERGFSTRFEAELDMRMDRRMDFTAANIIARYSEQELHKILEQYGEVTNAKTLARTIVAQRQIKPIHTISDFKQAVHAIVKGNPQKYFAQVFQALRIEVNDEIGALKELLSQLPQILEPGGTAAIITFHSLEDRLVKNFFRNGTIDVVEADEIYGTRSETPFDILTKKPITAKPEELKLNPRARSAKLRVGKLRIAHA